MLICFLILLKAFEAVNFLFSVGLMLRISVNKWFDNFIVVHFLVVLLHADSRETSAH